MSIISRFFMSRLPIHIGHVLLLLFLACAGLSASLYFSRATLRADLMEAQIQRAKMSEQLKTAEDVISAQGRAIESLQLSVKKHDEINRSLISRYRNIDARDAEFREKLLQLEKNNGDVQKFLDIPVPDSLRSLLNDTQSGVQGSTTTGTTSSNP